MINDAAERVRRGETVESLQSIYGTETSDEALIAYGSDRDMLIQDWLSQQPTYSDLAARLAAAEARLEELSESRRLLEGNYDRAVKDLLEAEGKLVDPHYCKCAHCGFVAKTEAECESHFGDDSTFSAICRHWGQLDDQERISIYQELAIELHGERQRNAAAEAEIEAAWKLIDTEYAIEPREQLEAEAKTNGFKHGLAQAIHTIWKRDPKVEDVEARLARYDDARPLTPEVVMEMGGKFTRSVSMVCDIYTLGTLTISFYTHPKTTDVTKRDELLLRNATIGNFAKLLDALGVKP